MNCRGGNGQGMGFPSCSTSAEYKVIFHFKEGFKVNLAP